MVLGMVAHTDAGREQLRKCGWAVSETVSGVAVPLAAGGLVRFFRVPSYEVYNDYESLHHSPTQNTVAYVYTHRYLRNHKYQHITKHLHYIQIIIA